MKVRLLLVATVAGVAASTAAPSHAWVVKCTKEWRNTWQDGQPPTVPATTKYVNCMV